MFATFTHSRISMGSMFDWLVRRLYSRKPSTNYARHAGLLGRVALGSSVYIWPTFPPDQNFCSKRSASRSASANTNHLRKIMVHEVIEASTSSSNTSCTGRLAFNIMDRMATPSDEVVRFTSGLQRRVGKEWSVESGTARSSSLRGRRRALHLRTTLRRWDRGEGRGTRCPACGSSPRCTR